MLGGGGSRGMLPCCCFLLKWYVAHFESYFKNVQNTLFNSFKDNFPQKLKSFAISVTNTNLDQNVNTKVNTFTFSKGCGGFPPEAEDLFI